MKKIILFLLSIILSIPTLYASEQDAGSSDWGGVASCFLNPCYCFFSAAGGQRYENWDGERLDKGPANTACPPFGKESGRDDNICLAGRPYPSFAVAYFATFCGEESPDSTYFEPKLTVRAQHCNALLCWTESHDLSWDGECVTMVGGYLFPLHRMCARVALPGTLIIDNAEDDPGYTRGQHLNFEGATKPDTPVPTSDGSEIVLDLPKLCLYYDPSLYTLDSSALNYGLDLLDVNATKQPFHYKQKMHPLVEALVFIGENAASFTESSFSMVSNLFAFLDGDDKPSIGTTLGAVFGDIIGFLGTLINTFGTLITDYIREIGQLNRVVNSEIYGCVNIPLGPYPPPFCETITNLATEATTQFICSHDINGDLLPSIEGKECVVSNIRNNYIHNAIRVTYDKFLPICTSEQNANNTDLCVNIENIENFAAPSALHILTNKLDIIQTCSNATAGAPCVSGSAVNSCTGDSCSNGYRLVYGISLGSYTNPRAYFRDDLSDCDTINTVNCQKIWGINIGEYKDIALSFPEIQGENIDLAPLISNFTLKDPEGDSSNFYASIVPMTSVDSTNAITQDPEEICVFEQDEVIGCQRRATKPKISIYECDSGVIPGLTCNSEFFNPKFIVAYKAPYKLNSSDTELQYDMVAGVITPLSYHSNSTAIQSTINLAGNILEAFVTDDSFAQKPFTGTNAPTPTSLYGEYRNNIPPIDSSGITNPNAVYVGGLEYINGKYYTGGKYVCLANTNNSRCPVDHTICVLSTLLNNDIVSCQDFAEKQQILQGLSVCSIEQNSCPVIDSLNKKSGDGIIEIRQCNNNVKCYDYPEALCVVSHKLEDRINPSANLGITLSDSQYFNTVGAPLYPGFPSAIITNYDKETEGLRDKTAVERGYCVEISSGVCEAQTDIIQDNGYASWPETPYGEVSIGVCPSGTTAVGRLERRCIADPKTKEFILEPLYYYEDQEKKYMEVYCRPDTP
ncbi:MAG: hypothetical protein H6909_01855 [Rickettsiaceae bacterium]|nr:hypothetical protein [Rickettsiaceae bacterium]